MYLESLAGPQCLNRTTLVAYLSINRQFPADHIAADGEEHPLEKEPDNQGQADQQDGVQMET